MKGVFCIPIAIFSIGCATTYHRANATGGYEEYRYGNRTFQVHFEGNRHTSTNKILAYLQYRCAELTIENGFDYFDPNCSQFPLNFPKTSPRGLGYNAPKAGK
jgi:hypothetical protein